MVPWKNSTVVKCLLKRPSSSRSGGFLHIPTIYNKINNTGKETIKKPNNYLKTTENWIFLKCLSTGKNYHAVVRLVSRTTSEYFAKNVIRFFEET